MQRLLYLKHAPSNLSKNLSKNAFPSLFKQTLQSHHPYQDYIFSSSLTKPVHHFQSSGSYHSFSGNTIHGFFSKSLLSKYFLPNTQFSVSSRGLGDFKIRNLRVLFRRASSGFSNKSFGSYGRTWRSWFNRLSANDVVLGLIMVNVGVFLLWRIADRKFMVDNFMISLDNFKHGHVHTLITSAFSHIDTGHIISNMIGLYFFGSNIGRTFGPEFLLKLYLAGAIGGSVFYLVHHAMMAMSSKGQGMWRRDPSRAPGLGASGAVNAIMLLDIFLNPRATLLFDFIIPVPAILLGIFLIGKDLLRIIEGDSNISGSAHLGGAAVAALAFARVRRGRF